MSSCSASAAYFPLVACCPTSWLTCAVHGFNQIGDDGAKSIASAVERSSSLRWLGLVRRTLLVLFLLKMRFFWYRGALNDKTVLEETDFTKKGLRKILVENNINLLTQLRDFEKEINKIDEKDTAKRNAIDAKVKQAQRDSKLVVLLKNDDKASYRNVIDVMDEFMICQIAKYFAVDEGMAPLEKKLIDQKTKS